MLQGIQTVAKRERHSIENHYVSHDANIILLEGSQKKNIFKNILKNNEVCSKIHLWLEQIWDWRSKGKKAEQGERQRAPVSYQTKLYLPR